jgi:SpoVK/Ycf46/Vps4 family AAA+-type ATPase
VLEHEEERTNSINSKEEDPSLNLLHGPPGAGKSLLIKWIRSYFETVWDWEHGVQFVILAPMNTMANNVGGETIHAWGEIPFPR